MSLLYDTEAFFCEVVTGRPNVSTITRGDLASFWRDADRLVGKKANQLGRCVRDFFIFGILKFDGRGAGQIRMVWPVLVMVEEFPLMPPIRGEVEKRLRSNNQWPVGVPRLTVIDADELATIEALVENGWTFRRVVQTWKRQAPELPLANWLEARGENPPGRARWHRETFRELNRLTFQKIFGQDHSPLDDVEPSLGNDCGEDPHGGSPSAGSSGPDPNA